jgi:hypothetical protein
MARRRKRGKWETLSLRLVANGTNQTITRRWFFGSISDINRIVAEMWSDMAQKHPNQVELSKWILPPPLVLRGSLVEFATIINKMDSDTFNVLNLWLAYRLGGGEILPYEGL